MTMKTHRLSSLEPTVIRLRSVSLLLAAFLSVTLLSLLAAPPAPTRAQIAAARYEEDREEILIRQADIKAAIVWSRGQQELYLSPRCADNQRLSDFAYVVAVPSRPTVGILRGALFHDLARVAFPTPPPQEVGEARARARASRPSPQSVQVISRKVVGAYDVSVLASDDGSALSNWLRRNGYRLPRAATPILRRYVDQGWEFVACRIRDPQSARGIRTGTLAPLRIRFRASRPILPVQFCQANGGPIALVAYLLIPSRETSANQTALIITRGPQNRTTSRTPLRATLRASGGGNDTDTLTRLQNGRAMRVFVENRVLEPEDCTQDYVWLLGR